MSIRRWMALLVVVGGLSGAVFLQPAPSRPDADPPAGQIEIDAMLVHLRGAKSGLAPDGALLDNQEARDGFLEDLRRRGSVTVLAEPHLATTNRQTAGYFSAINPADDTVEPPKEPFGVRLSVVPVVAGLMVYLDLTVSDCRPDYGTGTYGPNGRLIPGRRLITVQKAGLVKDGQTLVIGGLIEYELHEDHTGILVLKDIPLLRDLFCTKHFTSVQVELLCLVRARSKQVQERIRRLSTEDAETARRLEFIWALEETGTPKACDLLDEQVKTRPDARLRQEARAALRRLKR